MKPPVVHSFPPIANRRARLLILGSMPGRASLTAQRYYAHPQNAFWPIAAELFGFDATLGYERRCAALRRAGVALWDVLKTCTRAGSLDSDIVESSIVPNDFAGFLTDHPRIEHVFFNGARAEQSFARHVRPQLPQTRQLAFARLPSTSPANASLRPADKLAHWRAALAAVSRNTSTTARRSASATSAASAARRPSRTR